MFAAVAPLDLYTARHACPLSPVEGDLQPRVRPRPAAHVGTTPPTTNNNQACVGVCRDGTDNPCTQGPGLRCRQCQEWGRVNARDPEAAVGGCSFLLPPWCRAKPCQGLSAARPSVAGIWQQMGGWMGGAEAQDDTPHHHQRCWGPLSSLAIPGLLGQVTSQLIGLLPGGWGPQPWGVNRGVTLGRALKPPIAKWVSPSIGGSPGLGRGRLRGHGAVSAPGGARGVPVPPTRGSAHRWSHPVASFPWDGESCSPVLPPRRHHGVPGSAAALELGAVGALGAAR